jgi:hypothetical protein
MKFGKTRQMCYSFGMFLAFFLLISPCLASNAQAQAATSFSPDNNFGIPSANAIINFAVNGTYTSATLQNNTWFFQNLRLKGSLPIQSFTVAADNCNITIRYYQAFNFTRNTLQLRYNASGVGTQVFNMGSGPVDLKYAATDWSVITSTQQNTNVFLTLGQGWTISSDGTVSVTGQTGNISIVRWGDFESNITPKNVPFYQAHSVALAVVVAIAVIVAVAVAIKIRNNPAAKPSNVSKSAESNLATSNSEAG